MINLSTTTTTNKHIYICLFVAVVVATITLEQYYFLCVRIAGNTLFMPVATSIPSLIQKTVDALLVQHSPKTLEETWVQVPSLTWVSLQFCAKNPLAGRSLNYTCALNLSHKVQQRTLRATSIDSHYVSSTYKYMWSYGLWLHDLLQEAYCDMPVISGSCDDNCKMLPPPSFFPYRMKHEWLL